MHWNVGAHQFDDERGIISTPNGRDVVETVLEPKASALLKYFCQHPQKDLSRDELIANVWLGQIVSDNAINRVVVQLRKALRDDHTPRQFIKTIPKVGYRLIYQPTAHTDGALNQLPQRQGSSPRWLLFALVAVAAAVAWSALQRSTPERDSVSIQPLSRQTGWQFDADLSPDLKQLVFSVSEGDGNTLYLQDIATGQLQQISPSSGQAHGARWSHHGRYFVYIHRSHEQCRFHKVTLTVDGKVESNDVLQTCNPNSNTEFALSLDDEILYFVERDSPFSPYEAYALDMQEQQRWKLAQPLATSYGNHYLDVHPDTGKVLLLSEPKPGKSAVYEIDVPSSGYQKLHDFDYDLYSAVWGHQPNTIVHPAEHPSYQLLSTNLNTGQSSVIVSDSRRISTPRRINNGRDYLFASYLYNRDIDLQDYAGPNFNSAVMDYLPAFSSAGTQLAFVSKRAGFSEIYVLDITSQQLRTLDIADQGLTYYNLAWSPDDETIAANTSKGIIVYDLSGNEYETIDILQLSYAVAWTDEHELSFSQFADGRWQAYQRNVRTGQTEALEADMAFVLSDGQSRGFVTQDLRTFRSNAGDFAIGACGRYIFRFQLHIKFDGNRIHCINPANPDELLSIVVGQEPVVQASGLGNPEYLAIRDEKTATAFVSNASSDVMRTVMQ